MGNAKYGRTSRTPKDFLEKASPSFVPDIFHTIGLAERMVFDNQADNLEMKFYAYRRIIAKLREHYPAAPLLIASWDFYYPGWSGSEVARLLKMLSPENTLIFDYTADLPRKHRSSDFTQWGVVGKFPWVFGIIHAYEWESDLRGNYDLIVKSVKESFWFFRISFF